SLSSWGTGSSISSDPTSSTSAIPVCVAHSRSEWRRPHSRSEWATLPPGGVQRHALVIADKADGFQGFPARRASHWLAVPLGDGQLVPDPEPFVHVEGGRQ